MTSVTFSPDGTRVATGGRDTTARVWHASTGEELRRLDHTGFRVRDVSSVAFSPDGTRLATGTSNKRARVWDVSSGTELLEVSHPYLWSSHSERSTTGTSVVFSTDGSRLLTGARTSVCVWDALTGERLRRISHGGPGDRVTLFAFSPDGTRAVTAGGRVCVWDTTTGELLLVLEEDWRRPNLQSIALSPDGNRLATIGFDDTARVWDVGSGDQLFRIPLKLSSSSPVFTGDGNRMAMASVGTAEVWDAVLGRRLAHVDHEAGVTAVAFSPDGTRLATGGYRGVRVWQL